MRAYRRSRHWDVAVVEYNPREEPDECGCRSSDRFLAMAATPDDALRIVTALNDAEQALV